MAFKSTHKNIVRAEYLGNIYIFTVRHLNRAEINVFRARQAEIQAINAAQVAGDKSAVEELGKNTDLLQLADEQSAAVVLDIQIEDKEGTVRPALFEAEAGGDEKTWTQMSETERLAEVKVAQTIFHEMWGIVIRAIGDVRILGK